MGVLWEARVKSLKKVHIQKEVQYCRYTFEELSTVLARTEACLNARSLCPTPDEPVIFLFDSKVLSGLKNTFIYFKKLPNYSEGYIGFGIFSLLLNFFKNFLI